MTWHKRVSSALALAALLAAPALAAGIYDHELRDIDGKAVKLSAYRGQVLLIVNTASKCGYTPQYVGLEKLHDRYRARGLRVLGFPSNDFLWQEPGTDAEIKQFCTTELGVSFDLFGKVQVKPGAGQSPLFRALTAKADQRFAGPIAWNFEKFVLSRKGEVVGRFASKVKPEDAAIVSVIEAELAKRP